jgi:diguanylate cyclase (GGDEF)-like protein
MHEDGTSRERRLERRLDRERRARHEAEAIAERTTRALYDAVRELEAAAAVMALLQGVAAAAVESDDVDELLHEVVGRVCAHTGWPLGHALLVDHDAAGLISTGVWHDGGAGRFAAFRRATEAMMFAPGVGLPGRVLETQQVAWVVSVTDDVNFPRAAAARECGIHTALAFPVIARDGAVGVLEFFATEPHEPDEALLAAMAQVGSHLGRVVERQRADATLSHLALHDGLTSLPNRTSLLTRLRQALAAERRAGARVSLLFVDVDDFKAVNDSRGHAAGDEVLRLIAIRLSSIVGSDGTAARFGGDEFALLLAPGADAVAVAAQVNQAGRLPIRVGADEFVVSTSVGVAHGSRGSTAENVVRAANTAMHVAKKQGKDRAVVFHPDMLIAVQRRAQLTGELRHAAARGEMAVHYQPEVHLANGAAVGVEALLRWQHPEHGPVSPEEFVPLAEETGAVVGLGTWALEQACRDVLALPEASDISLSVNLSGRHLREPDVVDVVHRVLRTSGFPAARLCLEVTESVLVETPDAVERLVALKQLGVLIAIDDFGTGYSSLSLLQQYPADILKIDQSFISRLPDDDAATIVWAIVRLGHALRMSVVAEGIETAEQLREVEHSRCDVAQGYHFARPMTIDALAAWLASRGRFVDAG